MTAERIGKFTLVNQDTSYFIIRRYSSLVRSKIVTKIDSLFCNQTFKIFQNIRWKLHRNTLGALTVSFAVDWSSNPTKAKLLSSLSMERNIRFIYIYILHPVREWVYLATVFMWDSPLAKHGIGFWSIQSSHSANFGNPLFKGYLKKLEVILTTDCMVTSQKVLQLNTMILLGALFQFSQFIKRYGSTS